MTRVIHGVLIGSMIFGLASSGCVTKPQRVASSEACYHAIVREQEAQWLNARGWALVKPGDLVIARHCADEDIQAIINQIRALTNNEKP
jgi:starvation-inducible outer membrane lipoprotein